MKRICLFLAFLHLFTMLCACSQPVNNASDGTRSTTQGNASSSSVIPNENKKDDLTVVFYHADGAEEDVRLDTKDCDILIRLAKEANFAPDAPMNLSIKFNFVIRHYSEGNNDFFANGNVQYVDSDGNVTKDYVDVRYYLCYSSPIIVRMYESTEGAVYEAASLSEEIINELKAHFSYLEGE